MMFENPLRFISILGLFLDGIGALMVIIPDIQYFKSYIQKNDKIERIESGRRELLEGRGLVPKDKGYDEISDIIESNIEISISSKPIWFEDPTSVGIGGKAYIGPSEEMSREDQTLESNLAVDRWIERRIQELKQEPRVKFLRYGALLLLVGFSIQLVVEVVRML